MCSILVHFYKVTALRCCEPPSMLTLDIPRTPIPPPLVLTPAQSTTADHQPFTGQSTVQVDYIQRDRDPDGNKVTALGNKSNVQLVCLPSDSAPQLACYR